MFTCHNITAANALFWFLASSGSAQHSNTATEACNGPQRVISPQSHCCGMPDDESTPSLRMSFLNVFLVVLPLFIVWYFRRDPMVRPPFLYMISESLNVTCFQLDAIPTVGFHDPILSYFSALQFTFDGTRMLREGYNKVIYLSFSYIHPSSI